ncbi:hypothetical protein AB0G83_31400 [Streptomyces klenkii]|uniref:hypothetical protein n=1 Tax=Streptomyces klenkii TaxID=1420899 RepID=UPI003403CDC9
MVKIQLRFRAPVRGRADLVLSGKRHARLWPYVVSGGLIAVTSVERIGRPTVTTSSFASLMKVSILPTGDASPALDQMITAYSRPRPQ